MPKETDKRVSGIALQSTHCVKQRQTARRLVQSLQFACSLQNNGQKDTSFIFDFLNREASPPFVANRIPRGVKKRNRERIGNAF